MGIGRDNILLELLDKAPQRLRLFHYPKKNALKLKHTTNVNTNSNKIFQLKGTCM